MLNVLNELQLKHLSHRLEGIRRRKMASYVRRSKSDLRVVDQGLYEEYLNRVQDEANSIYDKAMFGGYPHIALKELKEFELND